MQDSLPYWAFMPVCRNSSQATKGGGRGWGGRNGTWGPKLDGNDGTERGGESAGGNGMCQILASIFAASPPPFTPWTWASKLTSAGPGRHLVGQKTCGSERIKILFPSRSLPISPHPTWQNIPGFFWCGCTSGEGGLGSLSLNRNQISWEAQVSIFSLWSSICFHFGRRISGGKKNLP